MQEYSEKTNSKTNIRTEMRFENFRKISQLLVPVSAVPSGWSKYTKHEIPNVVLCACIQQSSFALKANIRNWLLDLEQKFGVSQLQNLIQIIDSKIIFKLGSGFIVQTLFSLIHARFCPKPILLAL
jgi:hypothetical protein